MRITQTETYRNFLANIDKLNENYNTINNQVSSGKKLTNLKDSPADSAQLVSLRDQASEIDQYQSNIDAGSFFLGNADSILNEVNNLTTTIYAKGSQAASQAVNSDARATIAGEIRALRDQIVSLGNSRTLGRYIFAGSQTANAPFTLTGDAVSYNGDDNANNIAIDDGLNIKAGVSGSSAFNSIFSAVNSLLGSIDGNDLSGIKTALDQFPSALSGLSLARGEIGANLGTLNNAKTNLQSRETNLTKQKSQLEDMDMAEAVVKLNQVQTALQTAVSAGGSVLQQRNLFDFLG
jgi:flagellar hook-associated protein 3 FlgL